MKPQWDLPGFTLDLGPLSAHKRGDASTLARVHSALQKTFSGGKVGFYDLPSKLDKKALAEITSAAKRIQKDFEAALIVGIGGSYLGAASCLSAMGDSDFPLTWVSNIDPAAIRGAERQIEANKHAAVIISKSGNTTETLAALYHFSSKLDPKGIVVITDPESGELRQMATKNSWHGFEVPPNIGGRFSVLSAVGLLPCALGGVDIGALVQGASRMKEFLDGCGPEENPAYAYADTLHALDNAGYSIQYLMPYWSSLALFAQWYVQLWGESLGKTTKDGKNVGPTPVAALGTTDQHSLLQLFKEGPRNKVIGFVDVLAQGTPVAVRKATFDVGKSAYLCRHTFDKISHEAGLATQRSLSNSKVPTYRITIPKLDAAAMGALYFFFETATAFAGELYGVDAFNQPGVEESKKLLHGALSH